MNPSDTKLYLEQQLPAALDWLRRMVEINSFTSNPTGVNRLAWLTTEAFAPLGFTPEFVPAANPEYGNHLVLTRRGRGPHAIGMISHLDTVFPPEEEARNNFRWQPEGDKIFGPGTQDIKGGTAMMWLVLSALQSKAPEVFEAITWKLLWNSAEERYSPDFGDLCRKHLEGGHRSLNPSHPEAEKGQKEPVMPRRALGALIFETEGRSGNDRLIVVARKGRGTWRVTVSGRGAHAGSKHSYGANAAVQLGIIVQKIAALSDYSKDITFNVGTVAGGTVLNRVPHEAIAEGEFRAFTPEAYAQGKAALLALAGPGDIRSSEDPFACQIKVEMLTESRPWPRNPGSDGLYGFWKQAAAELGIPIGCQQRGGLSDGNLIWDAMPTLDGLGPWGDNDHCSERSTDGSKLPEYVEVGTFVPKALLNTFAILKLARSGQ